MIFHLVVHCKPTEKNQEFFQKVAGSYTCVLIDYKDYEGVIALSKYYVEKNDWEVLEVEEEYYTYEQKKDLPKSLHQYFDGLDKSGYSLSFNTYEA